MKIILSGAQGTGKTTVLNELKKKEEFKKYLFISEISRGFASNNQIPINKESTDETQTLIFNKYLELFLLNKDFISDRGLIDVLAYTTHFSQLSSKKVSFFLQRIQEDLFSNFKNICQEKIFYFPIEFEVEQDKFRSKDEDYRQKIDDNIRRIIRSYKLPFITIKGTVEERVKTIMWNLK